MSTDTTQTKVKKTRLTQGKRDVIRAYCDSAFTALIRKELKMDKSDAAMRTYVLKRIEEEYPAAEMKVLAKHGHAREYDCIRTTLNHDRHDFTEFSVGRKFLSPGNRYSSCNAISVSGKVAEAWYAAKAEFDRRLSEKRKMYSGLVSAAVTFEDVTDILPFVEAIRPQVCAPNTAVAVINDEIRAALQADNKLISKMGVPELEARDD